MSDPPPGDPGRGFLGPRLLALGVVALGLVLIWQATTIRQGGGYTIVGPRVLPLVVASGLVLLGGLLLVRTTLWPDHDLAVQAAAEANATHWPTVGLLGLCLLLYPFALELLGYPIATTLFVPAGAWVLGSRRPGRDLLVGLVLGLVVYVAFTQFLGVRLPGGPLAGVL